MIITSRSGKPLLAVVVMSNIAVDVRVVRHLQALEEKYEIVSVGFGPKPQCSSHHIQIPDKLNYLPLNTTALVPHILGKFEASSQQISAIRYVAEKLEQFRIDVVLLNDVATLPLLARVSSPTVVDMHEFAPLELEGDFRFDLFLRQYNNWLCHKYLPRAAFVTTVSDGLATRFRQEFSIDVDVIYNAGDEQEIPVRPTTSPNLHLVHTGLAAQARRLDVMIKAVSQISHMKLDLFLVEAPYQKRTLRKLTTLAKKTSNVRIRPPVKSSHLPLLINKYDLSLVYVSDHNFTLRHGMPNKLFDSIQARTGIVTSSSEDLSAFCQKYQIGISTSAFSAEELEIALRSLTIDEINRYKFNADCTAQVVNSASEGAKLREIVERTITNGP